MQHIQHSVFSASWHNGTLTNSTPMDLLNVTDSSPCTSIVYSVPHYKTGFLIFGHFVDYLQNHAISTHNTSKWSLLFTESFDTNVNTSHDNHMTQHDSKQQCVSLKLHGFYSEGPSSTLFTPKAWQGEWATKVQWITVLLPCFWTLTPRKSNFLSLTPQPVKKCYFQPPPLNGCESVFAVGGQRCYPGGRIAGSIFRP